MIAADQVQPQPAPEAGGDRFSLYRRFTNWSTAHGLEGKLAIVLLAAALLSGAATYSAMTGAFSITPHPQTVLSLLLLNLILLLLLVTVVARRLVALWLERRRGLAGARLHARLVLWFGFAAMTPTIIVSVFSALFLNLGMDAWFSERVRTAVKDSLIVAQSYLLEHQERLATEVLSVADALRREGPLLLANGERIEAILADQLTLRALNEAALVNGARQIVARSGYSLLLEFDPDVPDWAMDRARAGEVVVLPSATEDRVRALVLIDRYSDVFLLVGRLVDARVLNHVDKTAGAARIYEQLEGRRSGLQITFVLIFFVVALLILFAAVWGALIVATRLARPIAGLVAAAERVGAGDLAARVPEDRHAKDEIGVLSASFNRMTAQLESQQNELIGANLQLEERRRFTELVLSGVSAGVVGLDAEGRINLPNRSASELLEIDLGRHAGEPLADLVPAMKALIAAARRRAPRIAEGQITLEQGDKTRILLVRVAAGAGAAAEVGYVVTFDDVTALLSAQRKAAWADVARRIAHEIKNPLTPIQLSAERLKRKYLSEIKTDPETFTACTDTIVRQVGDIGRMVDEFSSFARMPAPIMRPENLVGICEEAVFLQRNAHPAIAYAVELPPRAVMLSCDNQQVSRALTNLLQNAAEALEEHGRSDKQIELRVETMPDSIVIAVEDNGRGLPKGGRTRLTEPYVTTRTKGTGLGLAIVKKIMEDHDGDLILGDRAGGGASVKLVFPLATDDASEGPSPRAMGAAHGA